MALTPPDPSPEPGSAPLVEPDAAPLIEASAPAPAAVPGAARRRAAPPWLTLLIVAALGGSILFVSGFLLGRQVGAAPGTPSDRQAQFAPFWDAYHAIRSQYVGTVDDKQLVEGAISGMFATLGDPFSQYLTSDQLKQTLSGLSPQFSGIGATMAAQDDQGQEGCTPLGPTCHLVVVQPIPGAPAEKAGLLAGDRLTAVDGASVDGLTVDAIVAKVRGPKGTSVSLSITRGAATLGLKITRDVINQPAVDSRVLAGGKVGYIHLDGFTSSAAPEFTAQLKALVDQGITRIVFDLRGDGGGYVDVAQQIASQFIGSGPIFWYQYADGRKDEQAATPGGVATDPRIQVVALIDKGSASASEIVAGALQDSGRAQLIGEQSYGKGTIQVFQALPDDSGGFRLSIAKWLTPKGRWIHHLGLTPDIPLTRPADTPAGEDPVLQKAIEVLVGSSAAVQRLAA